MAHIWPSTQSCQDAHRSIILYKLAPPQRSYPSDSLPWPFPSLIFLLVGWINTHDISNQPTYIPLYIVIADLTWYYVSHSIVMHWCNRHRHGYQYKGCRYMWPERLEHVIADYTSTSMWLASRVNILAELGYSVHMPGQDERQLFKNFLDGASY